MPSEFDIQYALENTHVLYEPDRRIDTFGSTQFEFQIISELMDQINTVRVRTGRIEAHKPLIMRPGVGADFDFDGFGPQAEAFAEWLKDNIQHLALLRYGFSFSRVAINEEVVHEPVATVCGKLVEATRASGNPMRAVIQGVDDTWEISLLKFTVEMIEKSKSINEFDFKRRGLL